MKIPDILTFLHRANTLKIVRRYKSSLSENGDTVADHSWRLALMVFVIASELKIDLDVCRAMKIALVHDLAEIETDDTDAYEVIKGRVKPEAKQADESAAMGKILRGISFDKDIYTVWDEYEQQTSKEAKFVKALDRIEAFLHLDETGTSVYMPKEFHGDYADKAVKIFDEASDNFPPLKSLLDPIKEELKEKFEANGIVWNGES